MKNKNCLKNKKEIVLNIIYIPIKAVNVICILALLLSLLSKYLSPDIWHIPAYLGLVFPIILLVNFSFAIFWICVMQWRWLLCSFIAIVLSFVSVRSTFGFSTQTSPPLIGESISLMSYNVCACQNFKKTGENTLLKYIASQNADIVCLQEFAISTQANFLTLWDVCNALKQYPYRHIDFKNNNGRRKSGVATFSKYPIINKKRIPIESSFNSAQYSDIVVKGDTIRVFNNHLESNRLTGGNILSLEKKTIQEYTSVLTDKLSVAYKIRAKQANTIAEEIELSPYKAIVCGDFNDVPISYTYHKIKGDLKDAFVENSWGMGTTFHGSWLRIRIDYMLHDADLQSFGYKRDRVNHSDHYPIMCSFKINN